MTQKEEKKPIISELRQDIVTGDWVVIAKARGKRPEAFESKGKEIAKVDENDCVFCHPEETGQRKDTLIYYRDDGDWSLRVFPNLFPAFERHNSALVHRNEGPFFAMEAIGYHEVIVLRDHDKTLGQLSVEESAEMIDAFRTRYLELMNKKSINYILIMHNHGKRAGSSQPHPHCQLFAIPVVSPGIQAELRGADLYWRNNNKCVFCDMLEWEKKENKRIVYENELFMVITPFASRAAFELWIIPKEHKPYFERIDGREEWKLGEALKEAMRRIFVGLKNPAVNFYLHTSPCNGKDYHYYHWHIEILPRTSVWAGFELATGIEISSIEPEKAAKFLKKLESE